MFKQIKNIGPGAMVAAAFIGPGTVTTATIAGGTYGYTLLWAVLFSLFATLILQEMSARLGIMGRMGIGEAVRFKIKNPVLKLAASILIIGAILVGNAAYEAGNISGAVLGFNEYKIGADFNPLVLLIGSIAFILLYIGQYKWIERFLIALVSIMGFVFLFSAFSVGADWQMVFKSLFIPNIPPKSSLTIIGLIGTTVVPYNLFLHASSVQKKWSTIEDLRSARIDTIFSILFGGLITMAILICAAVAFKGSNTPIKSANDLAFSLQPILGTWSSSFLALGFLAAGLSSAITAPLAAAFATSELLDWEKDLKKWKFKLIWILVLFIGVLFSSIGFKPIVVIKFAQIANGLLLPIIACFLLWIMNDQQIMGKHINSIKTNILAIVIIMITIILGGKSILAATGLL